MRYIERRRTRIGLTIVVAVVGMIVLYVVGRKVKSLFDAWKDQQDNKSELQLLQLSGVTPSFNNSWYESQARKVYAGANWTWYDWNCDEETTISALSQLENDMDFLKLVEAFGVRDGYDMYGFVRSCLNETEIDRVHNVWSSKGITKRL